MAIQHANAFKLLTEKKIQSLAQHVSSDALSRLTDLHTLIQFNQHKTDQQKITVVNDFFNQLKFKDDKELFVGKIDYWQTPIEFIINGEGDCEDFAIAKYFTLLSLGVKIEKMRITYVKHLRLNQPHMVLAYYEKSDAYPLVLDNVNKRIESAQKLPYLIPVYSFNSSGVWLSQSQGKDRHLGNSKRLNKWRNLIYRMQKGE